MGCSVQLQGNGEEICDICSTTTVGLSFDLGAWKGCYLPVDQKTNNKKLPKTRLLVDGKDERHFFFFFLRRIREDGCLSFLCFVFFGRVQRGLGSRLVVTLLQSNSRFDHKGILPLEVTILCTTCLFPPFRRSLERPRCRRLRVCQPPRACADFSRASTGWSAHVFWLVGGTGTQNYTVSRPYANMFACGVLGASLENSPIFSLFQPICHLSCPDRVLLLLLLWVLSRVSLREKFFFSTSLFNSLVYFNIFCIVNPPLPTETHR